MDHPDAIDAVLNCACGLAPELRRLAELLERIEQLEWDMARQAVGASASHSS